MSTFQVGVLQNSKAGTVDTEDRCVGRLLVGTADFVPSTELVDTTGAGDAFIGAVMYCTLNPCRSLSVHFN